MGGPMSSVVISGDTSGAATLTVAAAAGSPTLTLPTTTDTLVGRATTDTLTNKTLTSPTFTTPLTVANGGTGAATVTAAQTNLLNDGSSNALVTFNSQRLLWYPTNANLASSSLFFGSGGTNVTWTTGLEGRYNTGLGFRSMTNLTTGSYNTFGGFESGEGITTGFYNTGFGEATQIYFKTGTFNTTLGTKAMLGLSGGSGDGDYNTVVGAFAALNLDTANGNTILGSYGLGGSANPTGNNNTVVGYDALSGAGVTSAAENVIVGKGATPLMTTGLNNTIVGTSSGASLTTGNYNTLIGSGVNVGAAVSNTVIVGDGTGKGRFVADATSSRLLAANGSTVLQEILDSGVYSKGLTILGASAVSASHTGSTVETTLATISVPANAMGANGIIRVTAQWSFAGAGGTRTPRIKFGATTYGGPALTSAGLSARVQAQWANRNNTSSQVGNEPTQVNWSQNNTAVSTTSAIDTTSAQNITLTGQLSSAGDTITLESYLVELIRPS